TSELVDLVKSRIEITDGKLKAAFVVSRSIKGTKLGNEIFQALADYGLPVLETSITQRISYPTSASLSVTVLDNKIDENAASEIHRLFKEIKEKFL
uniref:hypothetical protein n=1 Tax=Zymomonas mobilis TaxID=542 RepID=UPI003F541F4F